VLYVLRKYPQQSTQNVYSAFEDEFMELQKMHSEAKDNVKFLTTLERHFKNLEQNPMQSIVEILPSLLSAIRMVWIISR
jgi:dynein heavy chain, axonemal